MKLCIATGIYPPSIGGPATYSKMLFDELPKRGIDVRVFSYDSVRGLPKGISHLVYLFKLLFISKDCDIIYAQDPVSVGLPAYFVSKILNKKFFVRVAGDYAWEQGVQRFGVTDGVDDFQNKKYDKKTMTLKKIQSFVVSHADKVVTPSKYFKELVSGWGVSLDKITHIYNSVDMDKSNYNKEESRLELNIAKDSIVLISAGRLVPWKGFSELIDAFNILYSENKNIVLYILGDGEQEIELKSKIKDLDLEGSVIMVGKVDRENMFKYLNAGDIFVLNTSFEGFSFQIVEAMHACLPVATTNIKGNSPELVENGINGLLFEPNNILQMVSTINELIINPELKKTIIDNAKERSKFFSKENLIENVIKLLS